MKSKPRTAAQQQPPIEAPFYLVFDHADHSNTSLDPEFQELDEIEQLREMMADPLDDNVFVFTTT